MQTITEPLKILLVEDNPADAKYLKIIFEEEMPGGFEMVHETRLGGAVQTFGEENFDLVLLDLSLPDEIGFETFRRMASAASNVPIVVLTGIDDEDLARRALQAGAQDYLIKGQIQRNALLKSFRYALERHQSQKNSMEELEQWALLDSFTGLLNRRGLQKAFLEEISSLEFDGTNLFALLLGLDNFKTIIDTRGRAAGDGVLKEVARQLKSCLPSKARGGWLSGDEFLVLLPQSPPEEAVFLAEKIRSTIAGSPVPWASETIRVSTSVGAVMVPQTCSNMSDLLNHSHFVLAQSKGGSKNKISYSWDLRALGPEITAANTDEAAKSLRDRLYVGSQPIYRLSDNRQTACEFFIRVNLPGLEKPRNFFRLCLQANLVSLMDYQSFRTCAAFSASADPHLNCHFNLYPLTLLDIPLSNLLECLPASGPKSRFCFEISEERILGDPSFLEEPIRELKKAGVRVALDEVGFGHSSLESLLLLEPDIIKVAKGFVTGIENSNSKIRSMVRFLKLAESLGAEVIVEGIQRQADLKVLRDLGVPFGQGMVWDIMD